MKTVDGHTLAKLPAKLPAKEHAEVSPSSYAYRMPELGGCYGFDPELEGDRPVHDQTLAGTRMHDAQERGRAAIVQLEPHERSSVEWVINKMEERTGLRYKDFAREVQLFTPFRQTWGWGDFVYPRSPKSSARIGWVIDSKYGYWGQLPARKNPQGILYARGLIERNPRLLSVVVLFAYGTVRKLSQARFSRKTLLAFDQKIDRVLRRRVKAREIGDLTPSLDTCRFCRWSGTCPAALALMRNRIESVVKPSDDLSVLAKLTRLPDPRAVTDPAEMAVLKDAAPLVEEIAKRFARLVRERALTMRLVEGTEIPGYDLKSMAGGYISKIETWEDLGQLLQEVHRRGVSHDELAKMLDPSLPKLAALISQAAKRGMKKKEELRFRRDAVASGFYEEAGRIWLLKKTNPLLKGGASDSLPE